MVIQKAPEALRRTGRSIPALSRSFGALAAVAAAGGTLWLLDSLCAPAPHSVTEDVPIVAAAPVPAGAGESGGQGDSASRETAQAWLSRISTDADIPRRALRAYASADLAMREIAPNCHLSWTMLAGIGRIESNHGRFAGALLADNGTETRPVIGIPLDGSAGIENVPDTDHGALDGDTVHDRAVGPMQFLPGTWRGWASDGNGDGTADPQNVDDAALTAGRYLCAGGKDLATGHGWWSAVLSYNDSLDYAQRVFAGAEAAARTAAAAE
ncbi:MAG: lytic murein transglycosylase [Kutzneria sp.]|nr:lytic murein transglycosylase [Kutzneria sp.]MBV9845740.1 lytic murein transglycosylase [Kutzneria sp.]